MASTCSQQFQSPRKNRRCRKMLRCLCLRRFHLFSIFIFGYFYGSHYTNKKKKRFTFQDCPESELDFRQQQCAHFDSVPFEGVRYTWVPYTKAPNPCELNCMPKGERFYYRHKAKVIDGTPCNDESLDVCVNGQCQV